MTFEEAKKLLDACIRFELRDHYFGDREVFWRKEEGAEEIAEGYFSPRTNGTNSVYILEEMIDADRAHFTGEEARELAKCGRIVRFSRNDETGPDEYWGA